MVPILFFHGLESGPGADKAVLLRDTFGALTPDMSGLDLDTRIAQGLALIDTLPSPALLVGSSMGGLVAVKCAAQTPEKTAGLVLFAPALWPSLIEEVTTLPAPLHLLHGRDDDVVPIGLSRDFAQRFGATLTEVDDGHRLKHSHPELVALVRVALTELGVVA